MMPTSSPAPDPMPESPDDWTADFSAEERLALRQVWEMTHCSSPPPASARREATWAFLQEQIRQDDRQRPARPHDRPPSRRQGFRLRVPFAVSAALGTVALLAWALVWSGPFADDPHTWTGGETTASTVHLPDGSRVHLDPGATLHRLGEASSERAYELRGTARFDVLHGAAHPFIVRTPQATVTVLGTVFTVHAADAARTRVQVETGRVAVAAAGRAPVELGQGEQAIAEVGGALLVRPLPTTPRAVFAFDDAPLGAVLREIEVLFGTRVSAPADLLAERLTITRHGPLGLHDLLQSICAPLGLRYRAAQGGYEIYEQR